MSDKDVLTDISNNKSKPKVETDPTVYTTRDKSVLNRIVIKFYNIILLIDFTKWNNPRANETPRINIRNRSSTGRFKIYELY